MQYEFARAIREGVKNLLWEHVLPRLAAEGDSERGLWTHFASAAAAFERQLAPARGVAVGAALDDDGDGNALLPPLAVADGCLTVLYGVCAAPCPVPLCGGCLALWRSLISSILILCSPTLLN